MKPRNFIFWIHLTAGVSAGIVILVMSVTGIILAYEHQILNWATRSYRSAPPVSDAHRASVDLLLANARAAHPDQAPTNLTLASDPFEPSSVRFGRDAMVYLNPYTGVVLGDGPKQLRSFFLSVVYIHRWLGASDDMRATGRLVTGIANSVFAILVMSGPFLWWPRNWKPAALRYVTFFRSGLSGRARDFNWHNTIGLWCAVPLFLIVLSGVVMSFSWANNLLFRLSGSPVPTRTAAAAPGNSAPRVENGHRRSTAPGASSQYNLDDLMAKAELQVANWRTISLRVPVPSESTAVFTIDQGDGGNPEKRGTLTLDKATANVVQWEPWSSLNRGRQMRAWVRFGHTGEAAGVLGETIAAIASLGAAFLVWTGLSLALRRLFIWWKTGRENRVPKETEGATETITDTLT